MRGAPGVAVTVLLATAVAPLNATMMVVALPRVMADLHAGAGATSLLVTGYLAVMAVLPPVGGRLGDRRGRRAVLLAGLAILGVAALAAARAENLTVLLACRVTQAAGGALAFPNALALVRELVTAGRRGLSFGLVGAAMALSAALGPPLGQLLVSHGGWRWIFAINLPLVGLAMIAAAVSLPSESGRPAQVLRRRIGRRPGLLHNRGLAAATLAMALSNLALYAALVGVPLLLADSGSAAQGGLLLAGLLVAAALMAPLAGRLADLLGRRFAAVLGLCALAIGLAPIALAGPHLGLRTMAVGLAMAGAGLGASSTAIQTGGIETVAAGQAGAAAGLLAASRYVGGAAGSGLLPVLLAVAPVAPLNELFAMAAGAALLAALAGAGLGAGAAVSAEVLQEVVGGSHVQAEGAEPADQGHHGAHAGVPRA